MKAIVLILGGLLVLTYLTAGLGWMTNYVTVNPNSKVQASQTESTAPSGTGTKTNKVMSDELAKSCHVLETATQDVVFVSTQGGALSARCTPFFSDKSQDVILACGETITVIDNKETSAILVVFTKSTSPIVKNRSNITASTDAEMWKIGTAFSNNSNCEVAFIPKDNPLLELLNALPEAAKQFK
jgi:hypothetical protein